MKSHHGADDGFDAFVGERVAASMQQSVANQWEPKATTPTSAKSPSSYHPQFTSDLQLMGESTPEPPREITANFGDTGNDIGPRVSHKWSLLGPIQYVNVPSTAAIYDPEQTETFEPEPSDKKRWLKLAVWLATLVSLGLFCFGAYHAILTHKFTFVIAFVVLFIIFFAIYLRLQLFSANVQYLRNVYNHESTPDYIQQLKKNKPRIIMSIKCFHYAAPGNAFSPADGGEDPSHRELIMEGDMKKVETFSLSKEFVFDSWEDQSSSVSGLENFEMIKLKLKPRIGFADDFTKQKFEEEQAKFLEDNKGRDQLYKFECLFEVPGLRPKSLSIPNSRRLPPMLSLEWYMASTFFLVGWPYNYWLDVKSTKVNYCVQKVVKREPTQEDLLRRVASERRVARKMTNASVTRTVSKAISRQGTDAISRQGTDAILERRNTSSQNEVALPMEETYPTLPQVSNLAEYPYEFSSPRGNFH